ncbi:hypothetical protein [Streptomyces fragilis]|uniref:Secreted protein n=1 Tax=Streptomyces fragilis TaxID=67301 RepID=A0ABV2YMI2_9ACTN|nr:hypothetical protein [Streptomyces fragilis]
MQQSAWKDPRVLVAVWAVLCGASLVATLVLEASPAPAPAPASREPGGPPGAECAAYVAEAGRQPAEAGREGREGGVLLFPRPGVGGENCRDAVRAHVAGGR